MFTLLDMLNHPDIHVKTYPELGLAICKYKRNVFYNNTWSPITMQARGHVYDMNTGELAIRPFDKVFNLGENGTGLFYGPTKRILASTKINGFMGAVTNIKGVLIFSTTGSLDSDFVFMIKREYIKAFGDKLTEEGYTYLFEVCVPEDPHIVPETYGLHFLAKRNVKTGEYLYECDKLGLKLDIYEMETMASLTYLRNTSQLEGYMCYDLIDGQLVPIFKVKTQFYLAAKFVSRGNEKKRRNIFNNNVSTVHVFEDEEMDSLVHFFRKEYTEEEFVKLTEQELLVIVRGFLSGLRSKTAPDIVSRDSRIG